MQVTEEYLQLFLQEQHNNSDEKKCIIRYILNMQDITQELYYRLRTYKGAPNQDIHTKEIIATLSGIMNHDSDKNNLLENSQA